MPLSTADQSNLVTENKAPWNYFYIKQLIFQLLRLIWKNVSCVMAKLLAWEAIWWEAKGRVGTGLRSETWISQIFHSSSFCPPSLCLHSNITVMTWKREGGRKRLLCRMCTRLELNCRWVDCVESTPSSVCALKRNIFIKQYLPRKIYLFFFFFFFLGFLIKHTCCCWHCKMSVYYCYFKVWKKKCPGKDITLFYMVMCSDINLYRFFWTSVFCKWAEVLPVCTNKQMHFQKWTATFTL